VASLTDAFESIDRRISRTRQKQWDFVRDIDKLGRIRTLMNARKKRRGQRRGAANGRERIESSSASTRLRLGHVDAAAGMGNTSSAASGQDPTAASIDGNDHSTDLKSF
jgi:hypothetical protein